MRKARTIAVAVAAGVTATAIVAGAAVAANNRSQLEIATGYAAQAACVEKYINSGKPEQPDLPPDPQADKIAIGYNELDGSASGSIFGLFSSTSYYVDNVGCVLADERPEFTETVPDLDQRVEASMNGGMPQPEVPAHSPELDKAMKTAMDVPGTRGLVVLKDGNLIAEDYGEKFDEYTPQLGWSMTKSVANVLAGRLAAEDPSFDVKASAQIPGKEEITYADLLRMQSGLEWQESYDDAGDTGQMLYRERDMGRYVADKPVENPPGKVREYSTGSTTLACWAMQENYGKGVDMAWELLFKPVGMASAMLAPDASGHLACGSSAYATPRDWAKLGQFVANNGRIGERQLLPENWMNASTTENPVEEVRNPAAATMKGYGSGWWLNKAADGTLRFPDMPEDMYWADGHDGQFMLILPSENVVVVRQGFSPELDVADSGAVELALTAARLDQADRA